MWSDLLAMLLAYFGPPVIILFGLVLRVPPLSLQVRGALLVLAVAVVLLVAVGRGIPDTLVAINLKAPNPMSVLWGIYGAVGLLLGGILTFGFQRLLGQRVGDRERFEEAAALPWRAQFFLVLSAAVAEETLFRGVAVGIARDHLGAFAAIVVSTAAFTLAHFRWSSSHLPTVAVSSAILGGLFVASGDLWACMLAHFIASARSLLGSEKGQTPAERAQFETPAHLVLAVTQVNGNGIATLLACLAVMQGVHVWIVTERPCDERVKAEVARLGIAGRVRWLEWGSAAPGALAHCEAVVLLSRCKLSEAIAYEAQLAGRPILVIEGALADVAPDVDALSVPRHNAAALSQAIRRVLENPELAERLAAARSLRAVD